MAKVTTLNLYHKSNDNHLILSADEDKGVLNFNSSTGTSLAIEIKNLTVVSADGDKSTVDLALQVFNINSDLINIGTTLTDEVTRATEAEGVLTTNLSAEVTRATEAEGVLTTNLSAEVTRAKEAERKLKNSIDNILSNTNPDALDSLTEIVAAFQSADSDLNSSIISLTGGIDTRVTSLTGDLERRLVIIENLLRGLFGANDLSTL